MEGGRESGLSFVRAGDEAEGFLGRESEGPGVGRGRNNISVPAEEKRGEKGGEEVGALVGLEEKGRPFGERLVDAPGGAEAAAGRVGGGVKEQNAGEDFERGVAGENFFKIEGGERVVLDDADGEGRGSGVGAGGHSARRSCLCLNGEGKSRAVLR